MNSKQEMLRLAAMLQHCASLSETTTRKRRRRRRRRAGNGAGNGNSVSGQLAIAPQNVATTSKPQRRRRRRGAQAGNNDGSIRLARTVRLCELKTNSNGVLSAACELNPRKWKWIDKVSAAYERCKFHRLGFTFRTAMGTTASGLVTYGVDWDPSAHAPTDRAVVSACTPFTECAIWANPSEMVCAQDKLNAVTWYVFDQFQVSMPGKLLVYAESEANKLVGDIFVHYDLTLSGPVG